MKCLGCDREIPWDGEGYFDYTCVCGARIFYERTTVSLPASLLRKLLDRGSGGEMPHIDYFLGKSAHWSSYKQEIYEKLRRSGAIWSWECEKCRSKIVKRTETELREGRYLDQLHSELKAYLNASGMCVKRDR